MTPYGVVGWERVKYVHVPYSTYYKPMGISSEQGGGLIIRTKLIYEYTIYKNFELKRGVGL